jgi:hypothetical protein
VNDKTRKYAEAAGMILVFILAAFLLAGLWPRYEPVTHLDDTAPVITSGHAGCTGSRAGYTCPDK